MSIEQPLLVILAGGQSSRMGIGDKATMTLGGRRMIDLLVDRFRPSAGTIAVSGATDRETGLPIIDDDPGGPKGPAGALWSVNSWLNADHPSVDAFFTVPVDAPFLPPDLLDVLSANGPTSIAADETGLHPTVGYWQVTALAAAFSQLQNVPSIPLHRLASLCSATPVSLDATQLMNINTQDDLRKANAMLDDQS
ncbi:MAG: molybdenum cofactor guanylyltransferase [Pseudomonadota bacterium]